MRVIIDWFIFIFLVGVLFVVARRGIDYGYEKGQVDCANGKQNFELRKKDDGSVVWEKKETQ